MVDISIKQLLKYSPHYFVNKVYQYRTDGIHSIILDHLETAQNALVLLPRGHGKSKMLSGYITWLIVNNPNLRIILASESDKKAMVFLRSIRNTIEYNPIIKKYYGELKGTPWSDHEIELSTRTEHHTEPTLMSVGSGSGQITGLHSTHLYLDDLVSFASARSQTQREKDLDWYKTSLMPVPLADSKIGVLGTRYHPSDLYQFLIDDLKYSVLKMPAIDPETGKSLCEWLYPLKKLEQKRKELGSQIWHLQYMNDVSLLQEGNIFKYEFFKFYDLLLKKDEVIINRDNKSIKIKKIHIGVDPAISQKDTADFTAITILGMGEDNKLYVLDTIKGHWTFTQQKQKIIELDNIWNPNKIVIEDVAYQKALIQELRAIGGLPIKEIRPVRDKISRAMEVSPWFENNNIFFNKKQQDLIDELLLFPDSTHDDMVDSLVYAILSYKHKIIDPIVISI